MRNFKSKTVLTSMLCAAALTLTACGTNGEPADIGTNQSVTETPAEDTTTAPETENTTEKTEAETTSEAPKTEETTTEQTSDANTSTEETEAPETTPEETAAETTPETTPAQPWTEVPVSGILYINTDGVYSRAEAVQGSTKVTQYALNDTVNVVARTDTDYFKLDSGAFIHVSYLSENKIEITEPVTAATTVTTTTAATTAATTTEEPAETTNSTWGQYGQRDNTQSELDFIAKTFDLLNTERAKEGLTAYQHLDVLDTISAIRAWELTIEYRSDHIRPDGSNCTSAFNQNGIIYGAWGENVAAGQTTPEDVVSAWMNSPPHRAAILSDDYTYAGVGYYYAENGDQGYKHYWTLEFYRY